MTLRRRELPEMPYWPLYLSRDQAAAYVGVSPNTFDGEVKEGRWPAAVNRGAKQTRLTWYRPALEQAAAALNGGDDEERRFANYRTKAKNHHGQKAT